MQQGSLLAQPEDSCLGFPLRKIEKNTPTSTENPWTDATLFCGLARGTPDAITSIFATVTPRFSSEENWEPSKNSALPITKAKSSAFSGAAGASRNAFPI